MIAFRTLLVLMFVVLSTYTAMVIGTEGWDLLSVFFGDMAKMQWPGQFNLDFILMLTFSGMWVAWRHQFSAAGLGLAVLAFFGGALFLSVYLFIQTLRAKGNVRVVLLGEARAEG
jgi:hypothetical protein